MASTDKSTIIVNCSGPGSTILQSKTDFNILALTAGNFTTQTGLVGALEAAYTNLTAGTIKAYNTTITVPVSNTRPSGTANRGQKWILSVQNVLGRPYTYTIPAAPGNGELQTDGISADLAGTNWTAFAAAFHAVATDPFGSALTLVAAKLSGRRR